MKHLFSFFLAFNILFFSCESVAKSNVKNNSEKVIKLYHYPTCPSCKHVVKAIKSNGWQDQVVLINAEPKTNPANYAELKKLRGDRKDECPFLVDEIHDKKVDRSNPIIKYLKSIFQ